MKTIKDQVFHITPTVGVAPSGLHGKGALSLPNAYLYHRPHHILPLFIICTPEERYQDRQWAPFPDTGSAPRIGPALEQVLKKYAVSKPAGFRLRH